MTVRNAVLAATQPLRRLIREVSQWIDDEPNGREQASDNIIRHLVFGRNGFMSDVPVEPSPAVPPQSAPRGPSSAEFAARIAEAKAEHPELAEHGIMKLLHEMHAEMLRLEHRLLGDT
jgi:hypothetical protein